MKLNVIVLDRSAQNVDHTWFNRICLNKHWPETFEFTEAGHGICQELDAAELSHVYEHG